MRNDKVRLIRAADAFSHERNVLVWLAKQVGKWWRRTR